MQKDKKLAILRQLNRETKPISLNDLNEKLNNIYAERTLRRYLAKMIEYGLLEKFGKNKGTKYQIFALSKIKPKAIGFDEIRVRYRQQRRELIRHIILKKMIGKVMQDFIASQTQKLVKKEDQSSFLEDVKEDLADIDEIRIVGIGVTPEQLHSWKRVQSKK